MISLRLVVDTNILVSAAIKPDGQFFGPPDGELVFIPNWDLATGEKSQETEG
ncbi:MAG: hypothetical protein ABI693_35140 [Bryobacteraceae bacterium]